MCLLFSKHFYLKYFFVDISIHIFQIHLKLTLNHILLMINNNFYIFKGVKIKLDIYDYYDYTNNINLKNTLNSLYYDYKNIINRN